MNYVTEWTVRSAEVAQVAAMMSGMPPPQPADPEGNDNQAHPERWKNPKRSVPEIPPEAVRPSTAGDQVPTDSEEAEHSDASRSSPMKDEFISVPPDGYRVGEDHDRGQDEPEEVEAVRPRQQGFAKRPPTKPVCPESRVAAVPGSRGGARMLVRV